MRCPRDTAQDLPFLIGQCQGFPRDPVPLCSARGIITQFFDVVQSFADIFRGGLVATDPFPMAKALAVFTGDSNGNSPRKSDPSWNRGDAFQRYKYGWVHPGTGEHIREHERYARKVERYRRGGSGGGGGARQRRSHSVPVPDGFYNQSLLDDDPERPLGLLEVMTEAMYGYDMRNCITNITACVCDHFVVANSTTHLDCSTPDLGSVITSDVTMAMSDYIHAVMPDADMMTPCEDLICSCENQYWDDLPYAMRFEYVTCLEKRVRGERMHMLYDDFPSDFYYRADGPMEFMHAMITTAQEGAITSRDYMTELRQREQMEARVNMGSR